MKWHGWDKMVASRDNPVVREAPPGCPWGEVWGSSDRGGEIVDDLVLGGGVVDDRGLGAESGVELLVLELH